jgi:hypothetical protein
MLTRTVPEETVWSSIEMSLKSAGPIVGVRTDPCAEAVGVPEADTVVGTAVDLVIVVVGDLAAVVGVAAGSVVDFVTGGIADRTAAFFVGAACGAQAASVNVSTNTVLKRNLIFIFFSPSRA